MLIIMMIVSMGSLVAPRKHIVMIDLMIEDEVRPTAAPVPEVKPHAVTKKTSQPVMEKKPQPVMRSIQQPMRFIHEVQAEKQAPIPEPPVQKQEPAIRITEPFSQATDPVAGSPVKSRETQRKGYLKEQFFYIRDLVQKKAVYPRMAQRLSWEGNVAVSFLILADGTVRDIKVVTSSGKDILDKNAVEAVRNASPFPRPPVEVELRIPLTYKLM